jgi:redox-sensitive bicupin YhaK (pirin superfamily)
MKIISGALKHKDNMGTGSIMYSRDVQRMSAGRGVQNSEFNASCTEEAYFLLFDLV